jgi:voltage-gated potassium channel
MTDRIPNPIYEIFVLGLSLYVILALAVEVVVPLSPETRDLLSYLDAGICVLFLADFIKSFVTAQSRADYFFTWGWIDLLSSIPFVGPARIGRAARIVRIIRVLRGFRSVRNLTAYLLKRRAQAAFGTATLSSILLIAFSSIAVLQFEPAAEGSNIRNAQDALWWAYVTITTVGYGDRFPVTAEGRVIGAILMTAGVGLFGTFTGFVASWFMTAPAENNVPEGSDPTHAATSAHAV